MISRAPIVMDRDKTSLESLKHSICCYNNTNCNYVWIHLQVAYAMLPCHRISAVTSSICQIGFQLVFFRLQFATISTKCFATVVMHFLCEQTKLWMHFVSNKFSPFHFHSEHLIKMHILCENGRNVETFKICFMS